MKNVRSNTPSVQPFLRWAGSKRQLIPVLSTFWNKGSYSRYVEPFAGSACLFFSLAPDSALLGDVNKELISMYKELEKDPQAVLNELKKLKKSKDDYYHIRQLDLVTLTPVERAARFIYLNRYCFNGLYRVNSQGKFNVPYCGDNKGVMPSDEVFLACAKLLKHSELLAAKYEEVLKRVKKGDFVYMDPPFSVRSKEIFNEYDASKFSETDIGNLRQWMLKLQKDKIAFLVSYAECDEADMLKKGFYWQAVSVRRSIAGFTSKRKRVNEILISNIEM